jgi:hypothetical protein
MLNKASADELVTMLQQGASALTITVRALREFPSLAPFATELTAAQLDQARDELGAWIAETIARKPIPAHVRGLWLAVSVSVIPLDPCPPGIQDDPIALDQWLRSARRVHVPEVSLEPHPETARGEDWELLRHWSESPPWPAALFTTAPDDSSSLEELAIVVTAAFVRDLASSSHPSLTSGLTGDLLLEVRPDCAGETLTVGTLGTNGFTAKNAAQNLWGS